MSWFDDTQAGLERRIKEARTLGVGSHVVDADKVMQARRLRSELERELERVKRWKVMCEGV